MRTYLGLIALGVALVVPAAVRAQEEMAQAILKIQGIVATNENQAQTIGYDDISINFLKEPTKDLKWIGVVQCTNEVGDPFEGKQIMDRIQGPSPTFLIDGQPDQVNMLRNAPVGSRVTFQGMFVQQARNFLLSTVTVQPPKK
ncbi:MAG TPA: hypothetical protein VGR62_08170 [Candidatus Binatia bacterium]|jgi:hypothetical protein|nr:hypothetical protein [Candidatus Binatia bacterium]